MPIKEVTSQDSHAAVGVNVGIETGQEGVEVSFVGPTQLFDD